MNEYIIGKAKVKIHGSPDSGKLKKSTVNFLKKVEAQRKRCSKSSMAKNQPESSAI